MIQAILQADPHQDGLGLVPGQPLELPGDEGRHHDVFQGIEFGKQVMKLEDEPQPAIAKGGQVLVIHGEDVGPFPENLSAAGALQGSQDMEKGGFAHPRRPPTPPRFPPGECRNPPR